MTNSCSSAAVKALRRARQRGERADARPVGELQRHAHVGARADALLHREPRVDLVAADVPAQTRPAALGHVRAERVAERQRLIGAKIEVAAAADVDDAVDELPAIEVGHVDRAARLVALEQVEHGAGRVGERPVGRRGRGRRRLDRADVHRRQSSTKRRRF